LRRWPRAREGRRRRRVRLPPVRFPQRPRWLRFRVVLLHPPTGGHLPPRHGWRLPSRRCFPPCPPAPPRCPLPGAPPRHTPRPLPPPPPHHARASPPRPPHPPGHSHRPPTPPLPP